MTPVYGPLHSASNLPTIAFQTQPCPVPPIQFEFKLLISLIPFLNVWPDAMNSNGDIRQQGERRLSIMNLDYGGTSRSNPSTKPAISNNGIMNVPA